MRPFSFLTKSKETKPANEIQEEPHCPSFDEEPWKSKAEKLKPKKLDEYINETSKQNPSKYKPIRNNHRYVRLVLKFLDTVPDECWIDEENEID